MTGKNWKEHPIAIAAFAAVGTITLIVMLYQQVVIPTYTISLTNENENEKLERTLSATGGELKNTQGSMSILADKIESQKSAILLLEGKLKQLELANLFSPENPCPIGLAQVRIGDSLNEIRKVFNKVDFPNVKIEVDDDFGYVTVHRAHSFFDRVTYFLNVKKELPITHISFDSSDWKVNRDILQEKLVEALGSPTWSPRKKMYSWDTKFNTSIYKSDAEGYVLMRRGHILSYWPDRG